MIPKPKTFDEYLTVFPPETQMVLEQMRDIIRKTAPGAEETISYGMPYYRLNGRLLYFAAFKNHIGFYPMKTGIEAFKTRISAYKWATGSVQFPLKDPLPVELITEIVRFRVKENMYQSGGKAKKR
jgi:uncharacterized protein YdhG (YjbR/CyaY superfamily)